VPRSGRGPFSGTGQVLCRRQRIRRAGDNAAPADGCASYRASFEGLAEFEADTHLHIHKENNLLFPKVIALEDQLTTAT